MVHEQEVYSYNTRKDCPCLSEQLVAMLQSFTNSIQILVVARMWTDVLHVGELVVFHVSRLTDLRLIG
jgi:hypothetical protein